MCAERELQLAKIGHRVGLYGWYISSDEISIAQQKLADVRSEANRYISNTLKNA